MILRIKSKTYDSTRVPIVMRWEGVEPKDTFIKEVIKIKAFNRFTRIKGFSQVITENGIFDSKAKIEIKFEDRDKKNHLLKHLYMQGDDCNAYVGMPADIPYAVITDWVGKMISKIPSAPKNIEFI